MADRLADAVSPYLRSHSTNPVDWFAWGDEPFAEARRRDVPVLVSIGYSTCHWCHVMARETFSDPVIGARLLSGFVAVKVDREEHPEVDASYLAAAGAFTANLGWPLNVFVTPQGRAFYAGTYWPPAPTGGLPSFGQVLDAVSEAWTERRAEVEEGAAAIADAVRKSARPPAATELEHGRAEELLLAAVDELAGAEDRGFGGFGGASKFPVAPALLFLLERAAGGDGGALALARRSLDAISGRNLPSGRPVAALRDRVDGGFFRYATRRDWSDPHYERMLYDNAQLLVAFTRLAQLDSEARTAAIEVAEGIARFLIEVLERPRGGFAAGQDSESTVDGVRVEGGYFALDAVARAAQEAPTLDAKVLTGWNGLAIGALANAGFVLARDPWIAAARRAADLMLTGHRGPDGAFARASIQTASGEMRLSGAVATLEDYGMLASGLIDLAGATGEVRYAVVARELVDRCGAAAAAVTGTFAVPGGGDPVLAAQGTALEFDPSEGAYPSGLTAMARASYSLYLVTGFAGYRDAATRVIHRLLPLAAAAPVSYGAVLALASALTKPIRQLVVVGTNSRSALAAIARWVHGTGAISTAVTPLQANALAEAGFGLFAGRQREAAYLCRDFVCRLPLYDDDALLGALRDGR